MQVSDAKSQGSEGGTFVEISGTRKREKFQNRLTQRWNVLKFALGRRERRQQLET